MFNLVAFFVAIHMNTEHYTYLKFSKAKSVQWGWTDDLWQFSIYVSLLYLNFDQ